MRVNDQKVLAAALPVFKKRGIRSANLRDIAYSSGLRLQELKDQFDSKKSLVTAFVEYLLIRHSAYLQVNHVVSPTAISDLQKFFQLVEKLASDLTPAMLLDLKKYSAAGWLRLNEFKEHVLASYLRQNLERGIREGLYRDDIEPDLYVALYLQLLHALVTESKSELHDHRSLLSHFNKIYQRGILSVRGSRM